MSLSREGYYGGHNTRKVLLLSFVLVLFRVGYHRGMIGNNTGKELFLFPIFFLFLFLFPYPKNIVLACCCFFVIVLVLGRSQVIALRESYSEATV